MPVGSHKKTNNHRGRAGNARVAGDDDVMARNAKTSDDEEEEAPGKGTGKGYPKAAKEADDGADEEKPKVKKPAAGETTGNMNAKENKGEELGAEMTRKQREEIERQKAKERYEKLHKEGKTDEAKVDLARLEEVKKRREEAKIKREADEVAAKEKEAEKMIAKGGMTKEVKDALGGDAARTGARIKKSAPRVKNEVDLYSFVAGAGEKVTKDDDTTRFANDGSMASCRDAEDDFM